MLEREREEEAPPISKDLVAASATPLVLSILREGDDYGYSIIKRVAELSDNRLQWTEGMLYPVLHRLEQQGLIESLWRDSEAGRRRKYYRIRREGLAELDSQQRQWDAVLTTLRRSFLKRRRRDEDRSAIVFAPEAGFRTSLSSPAFGRPWPEGGIAWQT